MEDAVVTRAGSSKEQDSVSIEILLSGQIHNDDADFFWLPVQTMLSIRHDKSAISSTKRSHYIHDYNGKQAREEYAVLMGNDGVTLLDAIYAERALRWLQEIPAVQTLRTRLGTEFLLGCLRIALA
jgi:hypothetical protein